MTYEEEKRMKGKMRYSKISIHKYMHDNATLIVGATTSFICNSKYMKIIQTPSTCSSCLFYVTKIKVFLMSVFVVTFRAKLLLFVVLIKFSTYI